MIIVTGGAGFIGSAFIAKLNAEGEDDVLVVDELESAEKWKNLRGKKFRDFVHKDEFLKLTQSARGLPAVRALVHLGACSSTTERDVDFLLRNNVQYSQAMAKFAFKRKARFIYASSAATYGDGELGYGDAEKDSARLLPLNPYGFSKQLFDLWMIRHGHHRRCVGLKFFNVYGPNEYHKTGQLSVACTAFGQAAAAGKIRLFKSYRKDIPDGEQKRDFIYVRDCNEVMWWLLQKKSVNGIMNLGTGSARSFNDLARAVFSAMGRREEIEYIDMPEGLRAQYQYFTQADMGKLSAAGCPVRFHTLEEGVRDYVQGFLAKPNRYL
jgi:ADP-L-glycero-D-manno-heptose 6-epimerase